MQQALIHLDNASSSHPKAPGVGEAMWHFIEQVGASPGRGQYSGAYTAAEVALDVRMRLAALFGAPSPRQVVFSSGATLALNMLLFGLLRPGDHVLAGSLEHNAVARPLALLKKQGVQVQHIPCGSGGQTRAQDAEALLRPNTRAIVVSHASNVCGALMPLAQLGALARKQGAFMLVDAAQTAGVFDIDMAEMGLDAVAFAGHKGLLGPQGIGGFAASDALAAQLRPVLAGGTGSRSDSFDMPDFWPDVMEPGTPNLPGIYGLQAALVYLEQTGIENIRSKEQALAGQLAEGLAALGGVRVFGGGAGAPIVSADFEGRDNALIAHALAQQYGIATRCGLHCAPAAHKALGTFPQGTLRFAPGYNTTPQEIDACLDALREILGTAEGN